MVKLMERIGHTSLGVALRYQYVMADQQAALAVALDALARHGYVSPQMPQRKLQ